jgi:hypothetical protein
MAVSVQNIREAAVRKRNLRAKRLAAMRRGKKSTVKDFEHRLYTFK